MDATPSPVGIANIAPDLRVGTHLDPHPSRDQCNRGAGHDADEPGQQQRAPHVPHNAPHSSTRTVATAQAIQILTRMTWSHDC